MIRKQRRHPPQPAQGPQKHDDVQNGPLQVVRTKEMQMEMEDLPNHIHGTSYQPQIFEKYADYRIPMDGNCFWKSLSIPLQRHWRVIKRASLRHALRVGLHGLPLAQLASLAAQTTDGQWCSTLSVCAAANYHKIRIHVHMEDSGRSYYVGDAAASCMEVAVRLQRGHYSLVQWAHGQPLLQESGTYGEPDHPSSKDLIMRMATPVAGATSTAVPNLKGGGAKKKQTSTSTPSTPGRQRPPSTSSTTAMHPAHATGEDLMIEHDLVPLQIADPAPDDLEITVLRQNYPWHRALRQGTYGWKVSLNPGTTVSQLQRALARQLKLRQSYLQFTVDGEVLDLERCLWEPVALTLKVDKTGDDSPERLPERHQEGSQGHESIAQRVHRQRSQRSTTPHRPASQPARAAPHSEAPRDQGAGHLVKRVMPSTTPRSTSHPPPATTPRSRSRPRHNPSSMAFPAATTPAERPHDWEGRQPADTSMATAGAFQENMVKKEMHPEQDLGPDLYGSDPPSSPCTADYEAVVLPPHLRRRVRGHSIYRTTAQRPWFTVQARNPIFLDVEVEEGTRVSDIQHLICGVYRRGEDLDPDEQIRPGDQIWWRPQQEALRLDVPDLRGGGKLTEAERQANMRAALQVVARLQVLSVMQAKFLLRGQPKLVKTMNSALSDEDKRLRIARTAAKLGVSLPLTTPTTTMSQSSTTTTPGPARARQSELQGQRRSNSASRSAMGVTGQHKVEHNSSTTTSTTRARSAPPRREGGGAGQKPEGPTSEWSLPTGKWSVPFMKTLLPGAAGITLAMHEEHAMKLWRAHAHQKAPAAMISPRPIKGIPRHQQEEVVFDIIEKKGDLQQQSILRGILIQLGTTPVTSTQRAQPIVVETGAPSTSVLALELVHDALPATLSEAVKQGKYRRELQDLLTKFLGRNVHLDLFKQKEFATYTQVMARVPTACLTELVMSSGTSGLFWSPVGEARKEFAVIWLRGDAATDLQAARQTAHDREAALFHRDGHYALRVHAIEADTTRAALGLAVGELYVMQGLPVHADQQDLEQILAAMHWPATPLPERRRVYRGMAEWRLRASMAPPRDKIALNFGDLRVNLVIRLAARRVHSEAKPERPPPQTWKDATTPGTKRLVWADCESEDEAETPFDFAARQPTPHHEPPMPPPPQSPPVPEATTDQEDAAMTDQGHDFYSELEGEQLQDQPLPRASRPTTYPPTWGPREGGQPQPKRQSKKRRQLGDEIDPVESLTKEVERLQTQVTFVTTTFKTELLNTMKDLMNAQAQQISLQMTQQLAHMGAGAAQAAHPPTA